MLTDDLLTRAGIQHRRNRFPKPPAGTYAVWMDDIEADGPDCAPARIFWHSITIELYEYQKDEAAEAAIEAVLNSTGLPWSKQDRYWLENEQLYQVVYEFDYVEKRRN